MNVLGPSNRRGRELGLAARPLLVLPCQWSEGNHNTTNQNKKPLTQISLQNHSYCSLPSLRRAYIFAINSSNRSLSFFDVFAVKRHRL